MSTESALALEDAGYQRLNECRRLGAELADPANMSRAGSILGDIIARCTQTLSECADSNNPHLLSHTHMAMAAAWVDAAFVEAEEEYRAGQLDSVLQSCQASLQLARKSGTTILPIMILPWGLVVLAGALRTAKGSQAANLRKLHDDCVREFGEVMVAQREARLSAARELIKGQCLLECASAATTPTERAAVLQRGLEIVRKARRGFLDSGAGDLAQRALEAIMRAEADLAAPSAWSPTHRVAGNGARAWDAPDPSIEAAAAIELGLEVRSMEKAGAWSHVLFSNGWSAWMDENSLAAIR